MMQIIVTAVHFLALLAVFTTAAASAAIVERTSSSAPLIAFGRSTSAYCCTFAVSPPPGSPRRPERRCESSSPSAHFVSTPPPPAGIAPRGLVSTGSGRTATVLAAAAHPGGAAGGRRGRRGSGSVPVRSSPPDDGDGDVEESWPAGGGGDGIGSAAGGGTNNGRRSAFPSAGPVGNRRRSVLGATAAAALAAIAMPSTGRFTPGGAAVAAATAAAGEPFVRRGKGYGYDFVPPAGFVVTGKPLKTHLDEVNFERRGDDGGGGGEVRGYQYGITVDPVRIDSLRQFGTPEEVAARVVTAELKRDGVMDVTLDSTREVATTAVEDGVGGDPSLTYYAIDYVSSGKRGIKKYLTKICIMDKRLYVLTAQIKEADYATYRQEISDAVNSFEVAHGD